MNVLHINTWDYKGGAAMAAYRLHRRLRELKCDSKMLVSQRSLNDPSVISFPVSHAFHHRIQRFLLRRWVSFPLKMQRLRKMAQPEIFSDDRTQYRLNIRRLPECDLINLHWIARFVDHRSFFSQLSAEQIPLFWTLHDMNPFTGGCHYAYDCLRHLSGCGCCPQLGSSDPRDLTFHIWRRKQKLFDRMAADQIHLIAVSKWMQRQVQQSPLLHRFKVSHIPNGIDARRFFPQDRSVARKALGIPDQARVVLFASHLVNMKRKGLGALLEALSEIKNVPQLFLLTVGEGTPRIPGRLSHLHLGFLREDSKLCLAYNAADVFVIPSTGDNLPNTVIEALACGIPVAGFDAGGIAEMVRPGETGLLAPPGDISDFRRIIVALLQDRSVADGMRRNCRSIAQKEFDLDVQAQRYLSLYREAGLKTNVRQ